MKSLLKYAVALCAFFNLTNALPQSQLLTFDDLPTSGQIPPNYAGFQWSPSFWYVDAVQFEAMFGNNGYFNGLISGTEVAFTAGGSPGSFSSSTPFNLNSAYLTAAFVDGMRVEVQGFAGTTLLYDNTYTLVESGPLFIDFNYMGVTEVDFIPTSGFAMDNLSVTVPEPGTIRLLILGLLILIFGTSRLSTRIVS